MVSEREMKLLTSGESVEHGRSESLVQAHQALSTPCNGNDALEEPNILAERDGIWVIRNGFYFA